MNKGDLNNKPVKKEPLEIARVHKKMELLNKLLSKNDKSDLQKKIRTWWDNLSDLWKDVFLINLHFARHKSQGELRTIMQVNRNPYWRYKEYFGPYDATNFEINDQTLEEIYNLRTIDCQSYRVYTLEPLAFLPNLEFLDASHNPITDILPLTGKTSLLKLDVNETNLTDITGLETLENLLILWLFNIDASFELPLLPNLKFLYFEQELIKNLAILPQLPKLEVIELVQVYTELPDLFMPNLKELHCYYTKDELLDNFKLKNPHVIIETDYENYNENRFLPDLFEDE